MLQIKNLSITHKKDLRVILNDFSCVLNDGDKAVIIGEEGNGKSTLLKWIYDEKLVDDYCETEGELIQTKERIAYLPQELPKEKRTLTVCEFFMEEESFLEQTPKTLGQMAGYLVQLLLNSLFFFGSALFWVQGGPILMLAALGLWAGLPILLGLAVLWAGCGLRLWGLARQRRKLVHGRELDHEKDWRTGKKRWWAWRGTSAVLTVAMLASILWLQLGSEAAYTHPLEESAFPLMPAPLAEELGAEPKLRPEYNTDRMTSHSDPLFTYRQANQWADLRTAQGTITLDWDITYIRTATPWLSHQAATALRHARRFGAFSRAEVQTVSGLAADEAFTWDNGFSTVLLLRRGREVALVQLFSHYADDTADALPLDVWVPLLAERLSG